MRIMQDNDLKKTLIKLEIQTLNSIQIYFMSIIFLYCSLYAYHSYRILFSWHIHINMTSLYCKSYKIEFTVYSPFISGYVHATSQSAQF